MNGFYNLILLFYRIPFLHVPATFDWIPFETRIQLLLLLDSWKAAIDRRENIADYGPEIGDPFPDEQERKTRFEVRFKEAYEDADILRKFGEMSGVLTPPELDSDFCELFCERKMYEARKIAGEPVYFANGHCCMDMRLWYDFELNPGPYPGLQNYYISNGYYEATEGFIRRYLNYFTRDYIPEHLVMMDENGDHALSPDTRESEFMWNDIIGPATYAERMRCSGVYPIPDLTKTINEQRTGSSVKFDITKSNVWLKSEADSDWPGIYNLRDTTKPKIEPSWYIKHRDCQSSEANQP